MDSSSKGISLQWTDVHYKLKNFEKVKGSKDKTDRVILNGVSGYAAPGTLTALIGASGAGKTSLLNILAGRLPHNGKAELSGDLRINGVSSNTRGRCAYVMQEPALFPYETARETAEFFSGLRLPSSMSRADKKLKAENALRSLGLGKRMDTAVGGKFVNGLSGGERQRVGIANEVVAAPGLVLCDEPTSGLDSTQALRVVQSLKNLAKEGRTVIVSIHQPRSAIFALFDQVVLLAGGRTAYIGSATGMLDHFSACNKPCPLNFNPADWALDITALTGTGGDDEDQEAEKSAFFLCDEAARLLPTNGPDGHDVAAPVHEAEGGDPDEPNIQANWCEQFLVLLRRSWREATRDYTKLAGGFGNAIFTSLITGALFSQMGEDLTQFSAIQNRTGLLFFMTINGLFGPLFGTIQAFAPEVGIVNRERMAKLYNVSAYYCAKLVVTIPFDMLPLLVTSSIIYWWIGLNPTASAFAVFALFYILMNLCSIGLAFFLAALAGGNAELASGLVAPAAIILLFTGGFYINADSIPVWIRWVTEISYLAFAYEGLIVNEFESLDGGPAVITSLGFGENIIGRNLVNLCIVCLAHHMAACAVLILKGPKYQPMLAKPKGDQHSVPGSDPTVKVVS